MGPIGYAGDVSMLHGIEMNVVGVAFQIGVSATLALPVAGSSGMPSCFRSAGRVSRIIRKGIPQDLVRGDCLLIKGPLFRKKRVRTEA
jgi:hypothetical protein